MNKFIKKELSKLTIPLSFSDDTTEIYIPKIDDTELLVNRQYQIKFDKSVTSPTSVDILSSNWNGGFIPKDEVYTVDITMISGNMVRMNGSSENCTVFNFWAAIKSIKVLYKY